MARPPKPLDPDRSALHWLGYELRRWRTLRGRSQKALGAQIAFSRVYVSLVETARERRTRQFVERCEHALDAGGHLLVIYHHVTAEQAGAHLDVPALRARAQAEDDTWEKTDEPAVRAAARGAPWEGGPDAAPMIDSLGKPSAATRSKPAAPMPATVVAGDVAVIRDMLRALTASDRQFGGAHARQYATYYLGTLVQPRLRAHGDTRVLRDLFAVSTEFALRVASMHMDAGDTRM